MCWWLLFSLCVAGVFSCLFLFFFVYFEFAVCILWFFFIFFFTSEMLLLRHCASERGFRAKTWESDFPWSFHALQWCAGEHSDRPADEVAALLTCPWYCWRLQVVSYTLKIGRSGCCTQPKELPIKSKTVLVWCSLWDEGCRTLALRRQGLVKKLSLLCWMDLFGAARGEIFQRAVCSHWRCNEWTCFMKAKATNAGVFYRSWK